jgi:glycosyltransferase involved in cell wall biosynthesis
MLIDDSELRNEMINRGFERIKRFSWDNSVKEHIAFYKELNNS